MLHIMVLFIRTVSTTIYTCVAREQKKTSLVTLHLPLETVCNPHCQRPTRPSGFSPPRPSDDRNLPDPRH